MPNKSLQPTALLSRRLLKEGEEKDKEGEGKLRASAPRLMSRSCADSLDARVEYDSII